MDVLGASISTLWMVIDPNLWWIAPLLVFYAVLRFPMPGRGPRSSKRDPWRWFKYASRAMVMSRAGDRCEAAAFLFWGRCAGLAVEVDHVYPHSKGGPTVVSNGQAMCKGHNRNKGSMSPAWWYILGLERRRRAHYPAGVDPRVFAVMNATELQERERSAARKTRRF